MAVTALPPLSEAIGIGVARLLADDPVNRRDPDAKPRDPSRQVLNECFARAGLSDGDVRGGKEKRVRAVLGWALDNDIDAGRKGVSLLISAVKGHGGFRRGSPNYVGDGEIEDLRAAFASEGWLLASDGELEPIVVPQEFAGPNVTDVLKSYVRRAANGGEDDALVVGTGKDLVEATAAHVLVQRYGQYGERLNFEGLLGQAFVAVGLAVPEFNRPNPSRPGRSLSALCSRPLSA